MSNNRAPNLLSDFLDAKAFVTDLVTAPGRELLGAYDASRSMGDGPVAAAIVSVGTQVCKFGPGLIGTTIGPVTTVAMMALSHAAITLLCNDGESSGVLMPRTRARQAAKLKPAKPQLTLVR
jgi:hypothetical protein